MFAIRGTKTLGMKDSLPYSFKKNWNMVGNSVVNFVEEAFKERPLEEVNKTLIVLIPNNKKPKIYQPI